MNKKISRILGTAVAVALLVSLVLAAVPVSAGTLSISTAQSLPGTTGKLMVDDAKIVDMDTGSDGTTVWAVDGTGKHIYKSEDAGATWAAVTPPSTVTTTITSVAIAPDDVSVVGIIADSIKVTVTKDGGSTWTNLGTVQEAGGPAAALHLFDIDLAPLVSGIRYIAVAGVEADATDASANVWHFNLGSSVPAWIETNDGNTVHKGFDTAADEGAFAVAFSPAFPSDKVMLAVTGPNGAAETAVKLQVFSFSLYKWNADAGFTDYAPTIATFDATDSVASADIAMSANYLGADPDSRVCFVAVASDENVDSGNQGLLCRFDDYTKKDLKTSFNFHSVAYNTEGDKLVGGAEESTSVYRLASASTGTSTGVKSASTYKKPGGVSKVVVGWAGDAAVAGTEGDESAFAVSNNDGLTFNDVSLIDTDITKINDIQVNADGTKIYMLTHDDEGANADLSLWRKTSTWQRVLNLKDQKDYLVRLAPDDDTVVYIANSGSTEIYYTNDGGDTKWLLRYCAVAVQDMAVESADVVYALRTSDGKVSKTTNAGFIWSTPKDTKLTDGYSLYLVSDDNLIVGGATEGWVSFSTDGNSSWTKMSSNTNVSDWDNVVACAASLEAGENIYIGTAGVGDQEIRRRANNAASSTSWSAMTSALDTLVAEAGDPGIKVYGIDIVTRENSQVVYAIGCDGDESWVLRTITPTASTTAPPKVGDSWSFYNTEHEFERAPRAFG